MALSAIFHGLGRDTQGYLHIYLFDILPGRINFMNVLPEESRLYWIEIEVNCSVIVLLYYACKHNR